MIVRIILICACLATAYSAGFYTIVAPKVLRPNSEFHAAVGMQGVSQPTQVTVSIGGKQDGGGNVDITQSVNVEPYATRIVKLEVGDLGPGMYNLTASGSGGLQFYNTTELMYRQKSYSVFIQTDKAIYKPGHMILFRVIVLNAHLKPAVTGSMDIHIMDGKGNRVKQWNRALTSKGVFSGELQLSQNPVLGDWTIVATVMDQTFSKSVLVAEYVLPKFEVTVDAPQHTTFKQGKVTATIRAKYTYGKPVKGEATITCYPTIYSGVIQPLYQNPIRKVIQLDGKATAEFDLVGELQLTDEYERTVVIDATVEESLTGRRQNSSTQVQIHKYKYKMELIKTSEYFKPQLKYTAFIKISHHDGSPVQDNTNKVIIRHGYTYDSEKYNESSYMLDQNGMIELNFYPPKDENMTISTLGIEAQYLDLKEWFSSVSSATSPSDTFIQAVVVTPTPTVNEDVAIRINSTEPMKYFSYEVLGRGDIIVAGTVAVPNGAKEHTFKFLASYAMAPTAHLIVYYVKDDGELVADSLDIDLNGELRNFVDIKLSTQEAEPGSKLDISIKAKPNSYVGLLGIDQSVLLLKSGNDLSRQAVLDELREYDQAERNPYLHGPGGPFGLRRFKRSFWSPGSGTANDVFEKSGAVILTNSYVYESYPMRFYMMRAGFGANFGGAIPMNAFAAVPEGAVAKFGSGGAPEIETPKVRSKFPETWIWDNVDVDGFEGQTSLRKEVPDTITSWVITGFSIDSIYGLGLIEEPRKLKVFQPFFVSLDLPYSIRRGEIVAIPIVVFNYMDKDVTAEVTLENTAQEFEFAEISNDVNDTPKIELYRKKRLMVPANNGASISFMVTPKKVGYCTIKVTARSSNAGDTVERQLLVKPEGETQYKNKALFVDLRQKSDYMANFTVEIPRNVVPDSVQLELAAVGDILGPSIPNLQNLIKMPSGCGEQNMLNFVPNIVVIEYLKNTNQLTPAVQTKAIKFLEIGYQQELTYKRDDGSFSAFGKSDASGSTWLTAFVAKSFRQAAPHILIEERIISDALRWLSDNQASDGSFPEVGKVVHSDMQGQAGKGIALTAYTLTAFLENQRNFDQYQNTINKALDYVARNLQGLEDQYALALCAYALHLANHAQKDSAFSILDGFAKTKDDAKWWSKPIPKSEERNPWHSLPNSVDVEMTSYALLTLLRRDLVSDSIPVMHWLVSQRNEQGGFASTQDTVVGIYALAKLAERITSGDNDVRVVAKYGRGAQTSININRGNTMILQKYELPPNIRQVNISATGRGFAIVQLSYRYNVNVTGAWPLFNLDPQVDKNSNQNHLQLSICSSFAGTRENQTAESNMAVMEVTLPSGFTVDQDSLPSLEVSQNVKRVETKDADTVVVMYFDSMSRNKEYCPTVSAYRTHKVAKQKPVPVILYDYYDSSRRARVFYEAQTATLCDICEGEQCGDTCSSNPRGNSQTGQNIKNEPASGNGLLANSLLVLLASAILAFAAGNRN
ncbi:LOW QUALITY PROTEIN: CD109 antigen-like [Ctenocephalides felis]|uniref:LOW QUALITY PROTEIN: CD109 antigen-like n=1 Tax=Ctenocephalides felis TaxID=7515 RepID=UPI000E6E1111|nr:LOW QUALITY PROTEIN: CD109 antigen-like [Ctenocephalides felis]